MKHPRTTPFSRGAYALIPILLSLGFVPALEAQSQPDPLGPTTSGEGPTRDAQVSTARSAVLEAQNATPKLMPRYLAFQEDFARDFGVLGPRISDRIDGALAFKARFEERWGDTDLYQWLERGIAAYSWLQATTRTEKKGFTIGVDANHVARGKVGIQMSRPLVSETPE
jgi:hypothetical protein